MRVEFVRSSDSIRHILEGTGKRHFDSLIELLDDHADELDVGLRDRLFAEHDQPELIVEVTANLVQSAHYVVESRRIRHDELFVWNVASVAIQNLIFPSRFCLEVGVLRFVVQQLCSLGEAGAASELVHDYLSRDVFDGEADTQGTSLRPPSTGLVRLAEEMQRAARALVFGHELGHYVAAEEGDLSPETEELRADEVGLDLMLLLDEHSWFAFIGSDGEPDIEFGIYPALQALPLIFAAIIWLESARDVVGKCLRGEPLNLDRIERGNRERLRQFEGGFLHTEAEFRDPRFPGVDLLFGASVALLRFVQDRLSDVISRSIHARSPGRRPLEVLEDVDKRILELGFEFAFGEALLPSDPSQEDYALWQAALARTRRPKAPGRRWQGYLVPESMKPR